MPSFDFHSPIEELDFPLFREKGLHLSIKRDDLIHPFISGNKWRKLKYILQNAREQQKNHLVTFGGPWSNHLLAMACAGAKFGFRTSAFVRGETVANPNLSLCQLFGMKLWFVDRESYRNKKALFEKHYRVDEAVFFVDEGGYCNEGTRGCGEIIEELDKPYDHIFCACGTGTTLAGLAQGIDTKGWSTRLHGIPVLKSGGFILDQVSTLYPSLQPEYIQLHTAYHFGGYAKTKPELTAFINHFCAKTGILIEPVYTGKLLYGVFDLATQGHFHAGESILVIHTGGLIGLLGSISLMPPPSHP